MSDQPGIYLDHAASTPMTDAALEAMLPWLAGDGANPSGAHRPARRARRAIDDARDQVADAVGAHPSEVVFTSGGTEADNLAVFGAVEAAQRSGATTAVAWCSAIEHPAVLEAVRRISGDADSPGSDGQAGGEARWDLPVLRDGRLDLATAEARLASSADAAHVAVISVMTANNEVGTIQPVAELAELVRRYRPGTLVHSDAVQALSWLDLREVWRSVDLLSLSAHKFGGPKGVGALVVRRGIGLQDRQIGGGQEAGRRAGTPPVASIVAMGVAAQTADGGRNARVARVAALRDRLLDGIASGVGGVFEAGVIDGDRSARLAGNAHVCIPDADSEALLYLLDDAGLSASAASSCASGAHQRSHVLAAMGVTPDVARGALRLSLGDRTTEHEIDRAVELITAAAQRLRSRQGRSADPSAPSDPTRSVVS